MTMEQLITSTRGLVDGGGGTPLRDFWGDLKSIYPETDPYGDKNVLNFADIEVIESTEPYNFPTATIRIKISNKKDSSWGVFGGSVNVFLEPDEDVADLVDKRLHMQMQVGYEFGGKDKEGKPFVGNPWKVVEIDGVSAAGADASVSSSVTKAKALLSGKTRAEFNKAALADTAIRKDAELQRSIVDKSFIKAMLDTGEYIEDENGVFAVNAPAAPE